MAQEQEHWRKMMDINFLGSYSLPMGQDVVLTIKGFDEGEAFNQMKQKKDKVKTILFAENYDWIRPWIVSAKCNMRMIEKATGTPIYANWIGKRIRIGVEQIKAKGEIMDALRVKNVSSETLENEYKTLNSEIDKATSQAQIKEIVAKYSHFKPFDTPTKTKIESQWAKYKPTATPQEHPKPAQE